MTLSDPYVILLPFCRNVHMMIYAVALNFNLVDVLVLLIIVRGFYIGQKTGFMAELLRLIGIICATFIILHYYIPFGNINELPFMEIWNGEKMQEWRRDLRKQGRFPACTRCDQIL